MDVYGGQQSPEGMGGKKIIVIIVAVAIVVAAIVGAVVYLTSTPKNERENNTNNWNSNYSNNESQNNTNGLNSNNGNVTIQGKRILPKEADFTVELRMDIRDLGTGGNYVMDLPQPTDIANAQSIINIDIDPPPTQRIQKYGGPWNIWEGSLGPGDREDVITIKITTHTRTLVWYMNSSGTVDYIPADIKNQYTGDEWVLKDNDTSLNTDDRDGDGRTDIMINPSAPEISNLAHQIADDKPDVYSKAKAIYDYMVDNFKYSTSQQMNYVQQEYGGLPKHALATLRDKWGDCDEQSMLYISLLRALGIPARMEVGILYDSQTNEWEGYSWVEIWIPSGSGQGYWYNVDVVNDEFLIRDANRLTTWIDDGDGAHLDDFYHSVEYTGNLMITYEYLTVSYESTGEIIVGYQR